MTNDDEDKQDVVNLSKWPVPQYILTCQTYASMERVVALNMKWSSVCKISGMAELVKEQTKQYVAVHNAMFIYILGSNPANIDLVFHFFSIIKTEYPYWGLIAWIYLHQNSWAGGFHMKVAKTK